MADDWVKRWFSDTPIQVITPAIGALTYLKLNCSNDPLTASLDVWGNISALDALHTSYIRMYHDGTVGNIVTDAGDISINPGGPSDINLMLGDALGVNVVSIQDSGSNQVASINSDGDINGTDVTAANSLYGAYLQDNFGVGAIDMTGDPWYMSGTSFEIDEDLQVNGTGTFDGVGDTDAVVVKSGKRVVYDGA